MLRKAGIATLISGALILTGCGSAGSFAPETAATATPGEVVIETFATLPKDESTEPETIPAMTPENIFTSEPEPEYHEEFEFPEEFYSELDGLIQKYGLNEGCDGTVNCSCAPEYETYDEEGNVVIPRAKTLSIYFKDLRSGFEFTLNPGAHYPVASTVKAPFCTLIRKKIDDGEIDPEQVLTYEPRHYFEGTGEIVKGDFGQQFTVSQLLELTVTKSDNVAYEMLKDLVDWQDLSALLTEYGCTHEQDIRQSKQKICPESAGAYCRIMYDYLKTESPEAEKFGADLQSTNLRMITSDYPVYRKYGWAGFSFHDVAFVDAPRPYLLAILSNLENTDNTDLVVFRDISRLIEKYLGSDDWEKPEM